MKYRLVDKLACPMCKHFPLQLIVIERTEYPERTLEEEKPLCELYCGYLGRDIGEDKNMPCEECVKYEVKEGVLFCKNCGRWYPIIDEIAILLPDDLRKEKEDLAFLNKYKDKLPEEIVFEGKPFSLRKQS